MDFEVLRHENIVIFGAGQIARAYIIALRIILGSDANVKACIVSNPKSNARVIEKIPVFSIEEYLDSARNAIVILAVRDVFLEDVYALLSSKGIYRVINVSPDTIISVLENLWIEKDDSHAQEFVSNIDRNTMSNEEYLLFLGKQLRDRELIFEVNLANHCNLKCQCCNHFSSIAEASFLNFVQYEKDLRRINELFGDNIGRVMLLGGEPLLNDDICKIMRITRKYIPTSALYLITNGLLFPKMNKTFWETARDENVGIKVTRYPLKFDYDYWMEFGLQNGVEISDENPETIKTTYRLPLLETGELNPYKNYSKCYHANQCIVLRDGRLYTCPISAWVDILNKKFNTKFPELEDNSISLYDVNSCEDIMQFLKKPIKMCEYCDIYGYEYNIPWKTTSMNRDEWIEIL